MKKLSEETLADKLFPKEVEIDASESILSIPPEQRRLHTETYDFSISTIIDYLKKGNIFIPEFQRRYVWSDAQASRLIESLIIQCPIPVIYLSQEKDEKMSVIDGNQRIRSLDRFINNHFRMEGLTAYPELEGQFFHEMDHRFQRHIENRTLRCIVIMKDTHPQVKFDVFERLNTGAVQLTAQELRHGLYHGPFIEMVNRMAKNKDWRRLLDLGQDKRMRAEEFLIRFFALHFSFNKYHQPQSAFLNEFVESQRDLKAIPEAEFANLLEQTIKNLDEVFGDVAFKVFTKDRETVSRFNAALFDAEILSISALNEPIKMSSSSRHALLLAVAELFDDIEFVKLITRSTSNKTQIVKRVKILGDILKAHL